jgi:Family of unknown function (DUF6492)
VSSLSHREVADTSAAAEVRTETSATSLSALLPLKVSGRHYADNLARVDVLFSSLLHFAAPEWLDELVIVVRPDEAEFIARHLEQWPDLPLRVVVENEHFGAFDRYTRPWQVRPWQRQQIIKLNAPAIVDAPYVLLLDPDVVAVKPITRELLLPGGRALLQPEDRRVHPQWWRDSADLLDVELALHRRGMQVTPALLARDLLLEVQRRLEAVGGRPWMDVLLTSYCNWTEYTLYLLAAERIGAVARYHVWADDPAAPARLQVDPSLSIWTVAAATRPNLERVFTADDPGRFAVVQSNSGLASSQVARVASDHFTVRRTRIQPVPVTAGRSKLAERMHTGSRIVAQRLYRLRRRLRRRAWRA